MTHLSPLLPSSVPVLRLQQLSNDQNENDGYYDDQDEDVDEVFSEAKFPGLDQHGRRRRTASKRALSVRRENEPSSAKHGSNGHKDAERHRRRLASHSPNNGRWLSPLSVDKKNLFPSLSSLKETPPALCVTSSPARREAARRAGCGTSRASSSDENDELRLLGRGGFGSVILGRWHGRRVAVKVLRRVSDVNVREANALHLAHENVVSTLAVFRTCVEEEQHALVVMDYVGQSNLLCVIENFPLQIDGHFVFR